MSGDTYKVNLKSLFPELSDLQTDRLAELIPQYKFWNERINVISRKDIEHIYDRHILHALSITKFTTFAPGSRILDLGTGGGIPGLPLAIKYPDVHFVLIDARAKKIKVINDIVSNIGLNNVEARHARVEDFKTKVDFVVSRAVAPTDKLVRWSLPLMNIEHINPIPNGLICLKGGDLHKELQPVVKQFYVEKVAISDFYSDPYYNEKFIIYVQLT